MKRKLASVQKIWKIEPIPDADRIELASVEGWKCVVPKGMYSVGENVIYFEIDSFLPIRPEFEFLRNSSYKKSEILGEGFRIKTQKMRGQLSQGLVMKLGDIGFGSDLPVKYDLTDAIGVKEWEIPEKATDAGTIIGQLPDGVPKTNETRIQSEPELLNEFKGLTYYITTKMDGSSHSIEVDKDGVFHVTGHNYEYKDDGKSSFYKLVKERDLENKLRHWIDITKVRLPVSVQGEFCAPGIQGNHLKLKKPEWYIFTVNAGNIRLWIDDVINVADFIECPTVPIEEYGVSLPDVYPTVDALLERAHGSYPNGGKKEGIVIRPERPQMSKVLGDWLSMKVINNEYIS